MSMRSIKRAALAAACAAGMAIAVAEPGVAVAQTASDSSNSYSAATNQLIAQVRQATIQYRDVNYALAHGFVAGPVDAGVCVQTADGVRGYHYSNIQRLMSPLNFDEPAVLVYQPDHHGGLKLVAAEFYSTDFDHGQEVDTDKPSFGDVPFVGPVQPFTPEMPWHYYQIAWIWQHNPAGMFADVNPAGSCDTGPVAGTGTTG